MSLPLFFHPSDPPDVFRFAEKLGRVVGRGDFALHDARAALALRACESVSDDLLGTLTRATWHLRDVAEDVSRQRDRALREIRRSVWPLALRRAPGSEMLRAARMASRSVLREDELLAECRRIARDSLAEVRRGC